MRLTNPRYSRDLRRYHLALRLLQFEARTGTICRWTGLSEARVRSLGKSDYASSSGGTPVRHRGPAPYRIDAILVDPKRRAECGVIAAIAALLAPLVREEDQAHGEAALALGESLCCLYETYVAIVEVPELTFEQVALIQRSLFRKTNLRVLTCGSCGALIVSDALSIAQSTCQECLKAPTDLSTGSGVPPLAKVAEAPSSGYQFQLF